MAEVEWTIELSHRAENNIDKILLYISQNSSLQKAQSFLKGFYEALEDLKRFPRMYAKLPDLEDPNIRNFIYYKYRIVYELIKSENRIIILTIFHSRQQLKL
jgi:plasmid stabilization system protein ParE